MIKNSRVKNYINREIEEKIRRFMDSPEIIAIVGPRQVGKTTLMHHIFNEIKASKVFLDLEDPEILESFNYDVKAFVDTFLKGKEFVFLDEFQYAREGGKKLKFLYDHYDKKFIISGSSSLELTVKIMSALVGRIFTFELFPLLFSEFGKFRLSNEWGYIDSTFPGHLSEPIHKRLLKILNEFIVFGGYPRIVTSASYEERYEVLKSLLITYNFKDIRGYFRISKEFPFHKLLQALSLQIGNIIQYSELSSLTGIKVYTIKNYLTILEETYIVRLVRPFFSNKRTELSKNPKIYFIDSGFRNYLLKDFKRPDERPDGGPLIENFVASEIIKNGFDVKFWRTKSGAEVDFIIETSTAPIPIEVKQGQVSRIGRSLLSFIKKYTPDKAFILHTGNFKTQKINNTSIYFLPLYAVDLMLKGLKNEKEGLYF